MNNKIKKNIMIVEDDMIIASCIKKTLTRNGYYINSIVSNGEDAVLQIKKNKPDLILMDIILDGKIDGIQTVYKIQSIDKIPIIYLSANTDNKTRVRANQTNLCDYIVKPFSNELLLKSITTAFKTCDGN